MPELPTQDPQLARTMENPFCKVPNLDAVGFFKCYHVNVLKRTPAEKIFCPQKLDYVKGNGQFINSDQTLFICLCICNLSADQKVNIHNYVICNKNSHYYRLIKVSVL